MNSQPHRPGEPAPPATGKVRPPRLTPPDASTYLAEVHGVFIATNTLMKLRSIGGGPSFRKVGQRVVYDLSALDAWAAVKLGAEQRSTADRGAG
jgi:hypothetical protein